MAGGGIVVGICTRTCLIFLLLYIGQRRGINFPILPF